MQKILIADDEPNILLSLDFLLRKNNYAVLVARNGTEAMEQLGHERPDLVLLDIMMPDVDGYAICKHIRSTPHLKNIKIIFLSAKAKESEIKQGLAIGADAYITKPFSTRALIQKINELLQ
jgi:CheY-like chemotaxis protein